MEQHNSYERAKHPISEVAWNRKTSLRTGTMTRNYNITEGYGEEEFISYDTQEFVLTVIHSFDTY